ncbi:MAG: coenzyme F420-0:L-glutamate ligase [Candidatus Lokiarchaeota archaeon]
MKNSLELIGLEKFPIIDKGDNLSEIILNSLEENNLSVNDGDVILIAQSVVSKSLGLVKNLDEIKVSRQAKEIYQKITPQARNLGVPEKSPELIQLILDESKEVVKSEHVLITETKHGFVCASAGIDKSNVKGKSMVSLLPKDSDKEAEKIRIAIKNKTKKDVAVIITDSFGRPFRIGSVGVALGVSGISPLVDKRGFKDLFDNELRSTIIAQVDNLASAAQLVMGEADEGIPVVLVRNYKYKMEESARIQQIIRKRKDDLFRLKDYSLYEDLLKNRVSYKLGFSNKSVDRNLILKCIELATMAPSAHNDQFWRYIVLPNNKTRHELIDKMNAKLREDLIRDNKSVKYIEKKINKTRKNFLEAPYLLILCFDNQDLERYNDTNRSKAEYLMGIQSISASATYLLLAFEIYELASCWYSYNSGAIDYFQVLPTVGEN